jgi:hypothetical protein
MVDVSVTDLLLLRIACKEIFCYLVYCMVNCEILCFLYLKGFPMLMLAIFPLRASYVSDYE